jgi:hypothetical protein
MIRTYALEPDVATDGMAFATFVQGLGIENGRLMAEFPKTWIAMAFKHLDNVQSVRDQTRITEFLKRLRTDGLVKTRLGLSFDGHQSWLENAIHHVKNFDAVICSDQAEPQLQHDRLHPASSLIHNPAFWHVDRRVTFTPKRGALATLLQPLLVLDERLAIMDPFFNPTQKRYLDGLLDIAHRLRRPTPLSLHASAEFTVGNQPMSTEEWEDACRGNLTVHAERFNPLVIARWASRDNRGRPHERWVITPRGGIELGRGIAVEPQENTATLLPAQTAARLWAEFGAPPFPTTRYELRDTVTLG